MKGFAPWLAARLREPSTYAGLAGLVASMTFIPNAGQDAQLVTVVGAALASALAIILPEGKPASAPLPTTVAQTKGP